MNTQKGIERAALSRLKLDCRQLGTGKRPCDPFSSSRTLSLIYFKLDIKYSFVAFKCPFSSLKLVSDNLASV